MKKRIFDKEILKELYCDQQLPIKTIARQFKTAAGIIRKALIENKLKRPIPGGYKRTVGDKLNKSEALKTYRPKQDKKFHSAGYVLLARQEDDIACNRRLIFEHREVAAKALGKKLKQTELVHHINGNKTDNRNSNLLICDISFHRWLHEKMAQIYMEQTFGRNDHNEASC